MSLACDAVVRSALALAWFLLLLGCRSQVVRQEISIDIAESGRSQVVDEQMSHALAPRAARVIGDIPANADEVGDVLAAIAQVRQIRGWPRIAVPQVVTGNEANLQLWLRSELEAQVATGMANAKDRAMGLLGILPNGFQSHAVWVDAFAGSIQGAYLPTRKVVILRQGLPSSTIARTLCHEMVHLYQDRLYDLGRLLSYGPRRGDLISTYHSFAEGEASHIEVESQRRIGAAISDEQILAGLAAPLSESGLPKVLRRAALAAYSDGYRFVSKLRRLGGWELVDAVWKRGLTNSAELLHPERWIDPLGHMTPRTNGRQSVAHPTTVELAKDSEVVFEDSLGEQAVRVLLEGSVSMVAAANVAAGWESDSVWLIRKGDTDAVVWLLRARSLEGALELSSGLGRVLGIYPDATQGCTTAEGGAAVMQVKGQDIVVVASGMSDTVTAGQRGAVCRRLLDHAVAVMAMSL